MGGQNTAITQSPLGPWHSRYERERERTATLVILQNVFTKVHSQYYYDRFEFLLGMNVYVFGPNKQPTSHPQAASEPQATRAYQPHHLCLE